MLDDIFAPRTAKRGLIETPGQTTVYHIGDAADMSGKYLPKGGDGYRVLTAATDPAFPGGVFSGNTNLDVAHYAANTISFTAPGTVSDAAAGLATILTGDTVVIKGSASNDGAYLVTAGGVAGNFTVAAGIVNELAGRYVSLYKRASHANAAVVDAATGLMWSRACSVSEKIGPASNGTLYWYWGGAISLLHPAAADLAMVAPSTLRIVGGAAEVARYHVGDVLVFTGFASANNLLPGWPVASVTVNGADLDIVLRVLGKTSPTVEAAGGVRAIYLHLRSAHAYISAANAASLSGFTDWRLPTDAELISLRDMETPTAMPNAVAFPVWGGPGSVMFSSVVSPVVTTEIMTINTWTTGGIFPWTRINAYLIALVRSV